MKLLRKMDNEMEAQQIALSLRSKGIVTHDSRKATHNSGMLNTSFDSIAVWAVLEKQHEDAVNVLNDPDYVIQNPLTTLEMQELENSNVTDFESTLTSVLNRVATVIGLILIAGFAWVIWRG